MSKEADVQHGATVDAELAAMKKIVEALAPLALPIQQRVIEWVDARLGLDMVQR